MESLKDKIYPLELADTKGLIKVEDVKEAVERLKAELKEAYWNIEDIWNINLPSAEEMVNSKIKEIFGDL